MRKSASSIVALGVLSCVFLSMMAGVYLGNLPSKEDLARIEAQIRQEHGHSLSSVAPVEVKLLMPTEGRPSLGLAISCSLRADIGRDPALVDLSLDRIGQSILESPEWAGRIRFVQMTQVAQETRTRTVRPRVPATAAAPPASPPGPPPARPSGR